MSLKRALENEKSKYGTSKSKLRENRELKQFPQTAEPAMVHPMNRSTVKLRDNGMVDVFMDTDNGIRLDPKSKSINMIGNKHRELVNVSSKRVYRYAWEGVNGNWTVISYGGDINLSAEKGNINVKAAKNVNIETAENGTVKAKNLNLIGDNKVKLESNDVEINASSININGDTKVNGETVPHHDHHSH